MLGLSLGGVTTRLSAGDDLADGGDAEDQRDDNGNDKGSSEVCFHVGDLRERARRNAEPDFMWGVSGALGLPR